MLDRTGKAKLIDDIKGKFQKAGATFIAEYQGIKAVNMNEIRKTLRDSSIEFKVVRNTLARRAIAGTDAEHLGEHLKGAVALVFSYKDAAAAAKKLTEFSKDQPNLKLRLATLGKKVIGPEEIKWLAELPSREVLLARLLGSMKSPVSGFVCVLGGVQRNFLYALTAIQGKKGAA